MRPVAGPAPGCLCHELGCYDSDDQLLDLVVPVVEAGRSGGHPTFLALHPATVARIGEAVDLSAVSALPGGDRYARPASTLRAYRDLLAEHVEAGGSQVVIVGQLPGEALNGSWPSWARYEAAVNHAFADLPLWGLCLYDTRVCSAHVLDDARRTHPRLAVGGGRSEVNRGYVEPRTFLTGRAAGLVPAPTPDEPPDVVVADPTPAAARRSVTRLATAAGLEAADVAGLVTSVSEAVGNAVLHGREPRLLEAWARPGRVEVAVHDAGDGPANPFAGLLPERDLDGGGGLGLWIAHQLCAEVTLARTGAGFTIRLVAGRLS